MRHATVDFGTPSKPPPFLFLYSHKSYYPIREPCVNSFALFELRRVFDAVREMEGMRGRRRLVEVACVTYVSFGRD